MTSNRWMALLAVRCLIVFIVIYLVGQFLEGPAYRITVRSPAFIIAVFLIGAFAAFHFYFATHRLLLFLVHGAVIPIGFIASAQLYYDGSTGNSDYVYLVMIAGAAQLLNTGLFLNGLFLASGAGKAEEVKRCFGVQLLRLNADGEPEHSVHREEGKATDLPELIELDGYSQSHYVDLVPHWQRMNDDGMSELSVPVSIYETIVKFGDTHQIKDRYLLLLQLGQPS